MIAMLVLMCVCVCNLILADLSCSSLRNEEKKSLNRTAREIIITIIVNKYTLRLQPATSTKSRYINSDFIQTKTPINIIIVIIAMLDTWWIRKQRNPAYVNECVPYSQHFSFEWVTGMRSQFHSIQFDQCRINTYL